jgi:hypothetical protein
MYFSAFNAVQKNYRIVFAPGNDTDPKNMIRTLGEYMREIEFDESLGDRAFCVFDLDVDLDKANQTQGYIHEAVKAGADCILSNPCFEVWFLCHFGYSAKPFHSGNDAVKELQKADKIPEYTKTADVHRMLHAKTGVAVENAKRLSAYHAEQGRQRGDIEANPITEVYKVVELLMPKVSA